MVLSKKRARKVLEEIIALFPDAKPSLDFTNHFELLVAVMLSAQTTDAAVNKVTPGLFAAFPTPQAMSVATENEIASHISRLGLYRNKAKFLKKCAQQLLDDFDGQVPQTREELESLAGVGRKTANVNMSVGFGITAFAVDTHVERIDEHRGILHTRRHLAASPIFKGIPDFKKTRIAMLRTTKMDELMAILEDCREKLRE